MEEVNKTIQFDGAHLELVSEENNEKFVTFLTDHVTLDEILDKSIVQSNVVSLLKGTGDFTSKFAIYLG